MKMNLQRIAVSNGSVIRSVRVSDILYFESDREKIIMHYRQTNAHNRRQGFSGAQEEYWTEETFCFNGKMKDIESRLSADGFCRVHKSYIVSIPNVSEVSGNTVRIDGLTSPGLPIGRAYSEKFRQHFKAASYMIF